MTTDFQNHVVNVVVDRMLQVIDEQEPSHNEICDRMMALGQSERTVSSDEDVLKLITLLQYFDRLQQRSRYLGGVVTRLVSTCTSDRQSRHVLQEMSDHAPHEADGQWLKGFLNGETGKEQTNRA